MYSTGIRPRIICVGTLWWTSAGFWPAGAASASTSLYLDKTPLVVIYFRFSLNQVEGGRPAIPQGARVS